MENQGLQRAQLAALQVPQGLHSLVMQRLAFEQRLQQVRRRLAWTASACVVLVAAAVPMWRLFVSDITQSGFGAYLSLGFNDFKSVASAWQDYSLSLLGSLPLVSTVGVLFVVWMFLALLKQLATYVSSLELSTRQVTLLAHKH